MNSHYGDFPVNHTAVCMTFGSYAASSGGASAATTNFAAADVLIYKDGSNVQRTSASGIVVTTSFDSQTGLQMVTIDLSDNTDAGFYAAGHEYQVAVADVTIDSQTVRFWLGTFSIERANGILALLKATGSVKVDVAKWNTTTVATPATAGIPDVNVKNIDNDAASANGTVTFPNATLASTTNITAGTISTVTTVTNQLTAAQIATGVWTDTTASDFTTALSIGKSIMNGVTLGTGLTVASVSGNVTFGNTSIATVTNLTNLPAITAGWLTAAGIAANALNGKGDWNIGKTGYSISGTLTTLDSLTTHGDSAWATATSVTVSDKTGFSLTQAFPANFASLGIGAGGHILTVDTLTTYTGNTPQTGDVYARVGAAGAGLTALGDTRIAHLDADITSRSTYAGGAVASVTGAVGSVTGNVGGNVTGSVGSVSGLTASDVGAIKAKTDNLPSDPADESLIIAATDALAVAIAALPTTSSVMSADIVKINGGDITGAGIEDTDEWRPA